MPHLQPRSHSAGAGLVLIAALVVGGVVSAVPEPNAGVRRAAASQQTAGTMAASRVPALPSRWIDVTHGVASGDVTAQSAVIWARASRGPAQMHVAYATDPAFAAPRFAETTPGAATVATDFTTTLRLDGLLPDTLYHYRVWFTDGSGQTGAPAGGHPAGSFRTAPPPGTRRPVSFTVGGDVGGQRYCRRPDAGYAIFARMEALAPSFFIANGDLIYADGACPAEGPTRGGADWTNIAGDFPSIADPAVDWTDQELVREVYDEHWRYNREDPHYQRFLQTTSMYAQWDDHEVIDNFGATWAFWNRDNRDRPGYRNLVRAGRDAFFAWNPIDRNPEEPNRIYRRFSWGADLDLFLLDGRSYRTRNDREGVPPGEEALLGAAQLRWLQQGLLISTATWKVVSSDVPLSIPTGSRAEVFGRDAFANGTGADSSARTGFERELTELLTFLDDTNVENVVFVVMDVHFAMTIRYETDPNGDGDLLVFHELVSGPNSAIALPPVDLDPTFNPTVLYREGELFNFQYVRLEPATDGTTHLVADVRGEDGLRRPGSLLDLAPR